MSATATTVPRVLYPHQAAGVAQILRLCDPQTVSGAIVTYGMGYGKTLTSCAALRELFLRHPQFRAALLLVPTAVLPTWHAELQRLGDYPGRPELLLFHGSAGVADLVRALSPGKQGAAPRYLVLSTCDTFKKRLGSPDWQGARDLFQVLVVDESHNFKNAVPNEAGELPQYAEVFGAANPLLGGRRFTLLLSGTPFEARVREMVSAWFLLTSQVVHGGEDVQEADLRQEMQGLVQPRCIEVQAEDTAHIRQSMPQLAHQVQYLSTHGWPRHAHTKYDRVTASLNLQSREYASLLKGRQRGPAQRQRLSQLLRLIRQLRAQLRGLCSHPLVPWGSEEPGPCVRLVDSLQRKRKRLSPGLPLEVLSRKLVRRAHGGDDAESWPPALSPAEQKNPLRQLGSQRAWPEGPTPTELPPPVLLAKFEFVYQTLRRWGQTHQTGRWVATSEWVRVLAELEAYLRLRQQLEPVPQPPWRVLHFSGDTPKQARASAEALFWAPAPPPVLVLLLLSKKAGGVGLNLTFADGLLMLEPGYTYAQDSQVVGRVQRLGGRGTGAEPRQVPVYYLVYARLDSQDTDMRRDHCAKARRVAVTTLDRERVEAELAARYTPEQRLGKAAAAPPAAPPTSPPPLEKASPLHKKRRLAPEAAVPAEDPPREPAQTAERLEEAERLRAALLEAGRLRAARLEAARLEAERQRLEQQRRLEAERRRREQQRQQDAEEEAARQRRAAARGSMSAAAQRAFQELLF